MAKPRRLPSVSVRQTFFLTSSTSQKRSLFAVVPLAELFVATLFGYRDEGKYSVHAFVLMRDHFHLLLTPAKDATLERCMQLLKGGFSYRAKKELGSNSEIWQRGFTDRRVRNREEYVGFVEYIHLNPVAGELVRQPEEYQYSSLNPRFRMDAVPDRLSG